MVARGRRDHLAACACAAIGALGPLGASAATDDPYAPLKLYDGAWTVVSSDGKTTRLTNHCARPGLFFACEQVVNGKAEDLVVFLPQGKTAEGWAYLTQALGADAGPPHPWYRLTIDGDRWVYAGPRGQRTLNQFFGSDHIRFEVQTSKDGRAWATTLSGEERRAP
ncbi:MAG: hypothetical protein ACR2F8_14445 [Caulobacteraceae bacterium]